MFSDVDAVDAAYDLVVVQDKGTAQLFPPVVDRGRATFETPVGIRSLTETEFRHMHGYASCSGYFQTAITNDGTLDRCTMEHAKQVQSLFQGVEH